MSHGYAGNYTRVILAGLFAIVSRGATAVEWDARGSVSPSVTYTDNVCLSESNKQGDFIGSLTPSGAIAGRGANTQFSLGGSIRLNSLTNSALNRQGCDGNYEDREQYSPNVRANFSAELIPQWMSLKISGRANQNEVTARAAGGGDELNRTGNTNTYYRYEISPTINRRFKDWVKLRASYGWDELINSSDLVRDSQRQRVNVSLANASRSQWSRKVEGRYTRVEYDETFSGFQQQNTELASVRFRLAYRFSRRWAVNGYWGEEWNQFDTQLNRNKDGNAWDMGVKWTPTPRTAVSVGQGDRFFGSTPRINIRHSHKRHQFSANYRKEITFERDIRTEAQGGFEDNINNPSLLSTSPILDERFALGWNFNGRDFSLQLNGNYSEQTRSEDGEKFEFKDLNLIYTPMLSTRYRVSGVLRWRQDEPRGRINETPLFEESRESETWSYGLRLSRSFNNRFSLALSYNFTDRQSNSSINDYQENRVTATLGIAL